PGHMQLHKKFLPMKFNLTARNITLQFITDDSCECIEGGLGQSVSNGLASHLAQLSSLEMNNNFTIGLPTVELTFTILTKFLSSMPGTTNWQTFNGASVFTRNVFAKISKSVSRKDTPQSMEIPALFTKMSMCGNF